jgi:hypothetical protein
MVRTKMVRTNTCDGLFKCDWVVLLFFEGIVAFRLGLRELAVKDLSLQIRDCQRMMSQR